MQKESFMQMANEFLSKEREINQLFSRIAGVVDPETGIAEPGTGMAEPGDLFFFVTHYLHKSLGIKIKGKKGEEIIKDCKLFLCKKLINTYDMDDWHVGIYLMGKKRKRHQRINLWMIHSDVGKGVHIQQVSPGYFTNESPEARTRMEILRFEGIGKKQRQKIIDFAISKVGSEFDQTRWKYMMLPYAVGLKNIFHKQDQYSCQQIVIAAYASADIYFKHPCRTFPIYNIARFLGYPLGHPKNGVDPKDPYLMDQHLYRDPQFMIKAAVCQDPETEKIRLEEENLEKYSWNNALRKRYLANL